MPMATSSKPRYLTRRTGRDGWYFIRSVPPKLRGSIGCATWRRKAGKTLNEAKKNAVEFLKETDQLIREARGQQVMPEQKLLSLLPMRNQFPKNVDSHDLAQTTSREFIRLDDPENINPHDEELHRLIKRVLKGTTKTPKTADDLLELATLSKSPAPSTKKEWERNLGKLMEHSHKQFITELTRDDALNYRKHLLTTTAASTTKTRLRYLSGLYNVAVDEGWIQSNPMEGLNKKVRSKARVKKVVRLDQADERWQNLPKHHQLLWHVLRWTGSHASEAAGLRWEDMDLNQGTISFKGHETRPLKSAFRQRTIPIHPKLMEIMRSGSECSAGNSGLIFPWAYNPNRARWAEGMHWNDIIGVSPKATRDWAASCLRTKDVNERTIGKLLGHSPNKSKGSGTYSSVGLETMRKALEQLE